MNVVCPECDGTGGVAGAPDFDGDKEAVTQHTCLVCLGKKKIYLEEEVLKAIKKFTAATGRKKKASFIQAVFTKLSRQATGRELRALRERDAFRRVIDAMDDYVQVLGKECGELTVMASNRGWKSTRIEEGEQMREEITQLRAEAGLHPMPTGNKP